MDNKINFYQEIEVLPSNNQQHEKYVGRKGGVMGISEEDGILYGYAIKLYDYEYLLCFDKDEVKATGKQLEQDDFY